MSILVNYQRESKHKSFDHTVEEFINNRHAKSFDHTVEEIIIIKGKGNKGAYAT